MSKVRVAVSIIRDARWMTAARARAYAWGTCALCTFAALAMFAMTKTSVTTGPFAVMGGAVLLLTGLHFIYSRLRPDPFIGPIAGGLAVVTYAGLLAGITALAALRLGAPLVDDALAYVDALFGVDTHALVRLAARHSAMTYILKIAYLSTVPLVFVTAVLLGWTGREALMWEFCLTFAGLAMFCAFLSGFVPAIGMFVHLEVPSDVLVQLPMGAGRFHLPIFEAYRSGVLDTVNVFHLEGVVSFPSFHTAMALMTAYALSDLRKLSAPAWAWSGLIIISTVPIGGHYFVDLLGGAAIWATFTLSVHYCKSKAVCALG